CFENQLCMTKGYEGIQSWWFPPLETVLLYSVPPSQPGFHLPAFNLYIWELVFRDLLRDQSVLSNRDPWARGLGKGTPGHGSLTLNPLSDTDFQKLEKCFGKNRLEGASLTLYPVPISNCIIVANLASEVTKDTVVYYFENTRKSGGGQVEEVVMYEDHTCLVYFTDFKLIDTVLERKHNLCGKHLIVKRYQDCLGRPEGEKAEKMLRIPEDLVLKDVDPQKIKFLKHSNVNRSVLETKLDTAYTKICWPHGTGHVVLACTLTGKVKNCFKLSKQWKETAEHNFRECLKNIIVNKVPVLQDIWSEVMEELKAVTIDNPEAVAIFVDNNEGTIIVVGNKRITESFSKKIDDITKNVMAEAEKEREKIKEVFTALKLIETRMLLADKFPTEMEKLFPDLKVNINQNKNEIVFEGPLGQVRDAKLRISRIVSFETNERSYSEKLKASHLAAVWDVIDGGLVVYSTSDEQIQDCLSVIRGSVIENTIGLKKASKTVVNSESWQTKVDELNANHTGKNYIKVQEDASKVHICATDDISNEIVDSVKAFLLMNTVTEVKVPCNSNVHRLIEMHHKIELQNIAKCLQRSHVQIGSISGYGGFEVHGPEDGIQEVRSNLLALIKRIQQREHTLSKPGLAQLMKTAKGKDNLNTIECTLPCVVSVKGDDYAEEICDDPYDLIPADSGVNENIGIKGLRIIGYCKASDCRNIYTAEGDMTELTVDMIVNSVDDKLSLTGGLGKTLVQKGGREIQKECSYYISSEGRLQDGDAFVSTAGKLKADSIVHVRGPVWRGGKMKEDEMLTEAVLKCLRQASAKSLTSVAIPAMSRGAFGYPISKATSVIVEAVKIFFHEVRESTVTDIYLCDQNLKAVEAFNEALRRVFGTTNFQKFVLKENDRPHPTPRKAKNIFFTGWWSREKADDQNRRSKGNKKTQTLTDPNSVTFVILALSEDIINQAVKKLESCFEKDIHFKLFEDSIIMKMDENQVMEIEAIARQFHLEMQLESDKGHILISGISSNVMSASDKIHRIMRDAASLEQAKHSAALMSSLVQWSYIDIGEYYMSLIPYDKDLNYKIETAYISKAQNVKFSVDRVKYVLDFNALEEYPEDYVCDVATVLRRDLVKQGAFEQPAHWTDIPEYLRVVVEPTSSQEYQDVSQQFVASAGAGFTVVEVEFETGFSVIKVLISLV
ncbi:protein mono-ADP-ribosyltransferase PARP14-like, partial [Mercenaria mercenaria]|uniref:protein mono-ADP-ribosyltransferase PARP14-like n=1 Tax=Mercenaria mercenaria TaxID=6596 RepID=UPI00234E5297